MKPLQIIQVDPEKFKESILKDFKRELKELSKKLTPKTPDEYLTRQEVSKLFKINISTVDNWTKQGKLSALYIGNRVIFKKSLLETSLIEIPKL